MKNREYRALLAVALMVSLVAGSVKGTTVYAKAEDNKAAVTEQTDAKGKEEAGKESEGYAKARKDETVYVKLDSEGNTKTITVSDQLKNIGDISKIEDISDLKEIENVKGDETFTQTDGKLVWDGESKDICYQGTTDKEVPVGIKISYQLDGKDISAKELEGKSGHVSIRYEYQNTTGGSGAAYTPFLMVTGLVLDSEKFSDVTIENGKLISDGEHDIAVGMGIPKLKEALDAEELDIPDYFVIEADVTDYEAVEGITVATNEVFNELSTDQFDDLDDLKGAMDELQSAANQLVDGSGQLKDGLDTLLASSGTLIDGIDALANGGNELAQGTGTLLAGAGELAQGSGALADGTGELASGAKDLSAGAAQVAEGAKNAKAGSGQLAGGAGQLNSGIGAMQEQAEEGIGELSRGTDSLKTGIAQVKSGADALNTGITQAAGGAASLKEGIQSAQAGADSVAALAGSIQLPGTAVARNYPVTVNDVPVTVSVPVSNQSKRENVAQILRNSGVSEEVIAQALAQIPDETVSANTNVNVNTTVNVEVPINADTSKAAAQLAGVVQASTQVSAGLSELESGAGSLASALSEDGEIKSGAARLSEALSEQGPLAQGVDQLSGGIAQMGTALSEGTGQLQEGTKALLTGSQTLDAGLASLSLGASQLSEGSKTLSAGAANADAGAKALSSGAGALSDGAVDLHTGAKTLSDGLETLKSGSGALLDGVQQLDDGAAELNTGMIQFNEEGIHKLVDVFDGDIDTLLDKVNDILDASKTYKNFSGISEEMDGEVKFIFVSDK